MGVRAVAVDVKVLAKAHVKVVVAAVKVPALESVQVSAEVLVLVAVVQVVLQAAQVVAEVIVKAVAEVLVLGVVVHARLVQAVVQVLVLVRVQKVALLNVSHVLDNALVLVKELAQVDATLRVRHLVDVLVAEVDAVQVAQEVAQAVVPAVVQEVVLQLVLEDVLVDVQAVQVVALPNVQEVVHKLAILDVLQVQ